MVNQSEIRVSPEATVPVADGSYPVRAQQYAAQLRLNGSSQLHGFPGQRRSRTDYLGNDSRWVRRNRLSNASQAPNFGHSDSGVTFAFDPLQTLAVGLPKALLR